MSGPIPGLDPDGKVVLKVDPSHVTIDAKGKMTINHPKMQDFLKNHQSGTDAHIILMGSECGCQCCC